MICVLPDGRSAVRRTWPAVAVREVEGGGGGRREGGTAAAPDD